MPIGVHGIERVNVSLLPHGDHLTLVDAGVWHPEPADDHGLRPLEEGLHQHGYALRDVSRIVVTHAHIDHYGLAGRLMEISGAELWMHTMTDLDCEKYRHPETAVARRRDMFADHGLTGAELESASKGLHDWLPYLYSVVEASKRLGGGEQLSVGGSTWEVLHTPGHSYGHLCLWSAAEKVLISGDHLLPKISPPVTFERGFQRDPLGSYLESLELVSTLAPAVVLPGHGQPFTDGARRAGAILRNKLRRLDAVHELIQERPCSVAEITDRLFKGTLLSFQKNFAMSETLAYIGRLRWTGVIDRRVRSDGSYEWYCID